MVMNETNEKITYTLKHAELAVVVGNRHMRFGYEPVDSIK